MTGKNVFQTCWRRKKSQHSRRYLSICLRFGSVHVLALISLPLKGKQKHSCDIYVKGLKFQIIHWCDSSF